MGYINHTLKMNTNSKFGFSSYLIECKYGTHNNLGKFEKILAGRETTFKD